MTTLIAAICVGIEIALILIFTAWILRIQKRPRRDVKDRSIRIKAIQKMIDYLSIHALVF